MIRMIAARLASSALSIVILVTLVFFMAHLTPGGPAYSILGMKATAASVAQLNARLGLDAPLWRQYGDLVVAFAARPARLFLSAEPPGRAVAVALRAEHAGVLQRLDRHQHCALDRRRPGCRACMAGAGRQSSSARCSWGFTPCRRSLSPPCSCSGSPCGFGCSRPAASPICALAHPGIGSLRRASGAAGHHRHAAHRRRAVALFRRGGARGAGPGLCAHGAGERGWLSPPSCSAMCCAMRCARW